EAEYYGPWNSVLFHFFDLSEGYTICPQYPVIFGESDTIDFAVVVRLIVQHHKSVVFFVEVKAAKFLSSTWKRMEADNQMRHRFLQLYETTPDIIYGVSAFGTQCSNYHMDKDDDGIIPKVTPAPDPTRVHNGAPMSLWNYDVCTEEGYAKFAEIVREAKAAGIAKRK
ncbi:hypothetical protein CPC08DRAFT_650710, partial [Agrocybe pediades]